MERKWTKGPWCVTAFDSIEEAHEDGDFQWASDWDYLKQGRPCEVWDVAERGGITGLPGSIEVGEHNAHLIAAAPDLYEALEEMVMDWDDELPSDRQINFVGRAREALAKARGE